MRKILIHAHLAVDNAKWTDPHTKANALLQAHFARSNLSADLQADQRVVVPLATRLLQARSPHPHAPSPPMRRAQTSGTASFPCSDDSTMSCCKQLAQPPAKCILSGSLLQRKHGAMPVLAYAYIGC